LTLTVAAEEAARHRFAIERSGKPRMTDEGHTQTTEPDFAHLIQTNRLEMVDVLGPIVGFLTPPADDDTSSCVLLGMIPAGGFVPLHSHPDPETFIAISGDLEGLAERPGGFDWVQIAPGRAFHVPANAKHAFRNRSQHPAVSYVATTSKLGRFFREVGAPVQQRQSGPPSSETVRHFLDTAERYGYWNGSAEDNAAVGLQVLPAT
jgi:quercetin dioxygenase-like cupin family protein